MKKSNFTRRDFLKTGGIAAAGALFLKKPLNLFAKSEGKTRIILIRNQDLFKDPSSTSQIMKEMFDESITALFKTKDAKSAWAKIIRPTDVVGIKTNVWKYIPIPPELEQAIKQNVMAVGVKEENISIDDRGIRNNPVFKRATALINTRPMRTHYWSGVGTLIKNYIMFVDNPPAYHPDSCADLAAIWKLPNIVGKTRLNILVMITPQFHSVGPHSFSKEYVWNYNGLIVGEDPVACDAVGLKIIEAKRKLYFKEDTPLNPPAKHIELADTRHHIGTADMNKIDLVKLGWKEDILI